MQVKQKPNTLVCYICGREFGSKSLHIHLKSCQSKFHQEQSQKEKKDRKMLPPQPPLLRQLLNGNLQNLQIYNEQALQIHKYQVLPACKFCGRTFNEESLKVHVNVCSKKTNAVNNEPIKKIYDDQIKKPRTLACCVCGRQFGLTSLKIHYPQCIEKFQIEQQKKPREQRRKTPIFSLAEIDLFENKTDWTIQEIQSFNAKSMAIFRQKGMVHCQICKRSFMPEPYQKHLRSCKQNNKDYKAPTAVQTSSMQIDAKKPKVLMCHICGRQFGLSSLAIHQKTCKQKFVNAQKLKPKSQRRSLPTLPTGFLAKFSLQDTEKWSIQKIEEYNRMCNEVYRNQSMFQCNICKRKFIETAYLKHKNYCEKNNKPQVDDQSKKIQLPSPQIQKKSTKEKFIKEIKVENVIPQTAEQLQETVVFQNLKQTSQNSNIQAPNQKSISNKDEEKIKIDEQNVSSKTNSQQQINSQHSQKVLQEKKEDPIIKNQSNLIEQSLELHPCEKCGRKFLAERLQKHISVCKGGKIIPNFKRKNANKPKDQQQNQGNYRSQRVQSKIPKQEELAPQNHSKQLIPCSKCGRRFLQNRLSKHQQCCKGKQNGNSQNPKELFEKSKEKFFQPEEKSKKIVPPETNVGNNESFQVIQLKPCPKCDRKFAIDRLQVHENICKGKPKMKIDPPQKAKTIQVIKKTKQNFFKMVQDIKSKKINEQQIDRQIDSELQTLGNTEPRHKIQHIVKKQNESKALNKEGQKSLSKQIDPDKISKWKRQNIAKRSPEKQFKKQGRTQSHLPKI